jgi:hypothetical protein
VLLETSTWASTGWRLELESGVTFIAAQSILESHSGYLPSELVQFMNSQLGIRLPWGFWLPWGLWLPSGICYLGNSVTFMVALRVRESHYGKMPSE